MYPDGNVPIDTILETYRTIKFDRQGMVKKQARGESIAEMYQIQADCMAKIKKVEKFISAKYVP